MTRQEFVNKVRRRLKSEASYYSGVVDYKINGMERVTNLFDYNGILKERLSPYKEKYAGNALYGMGWSLRTYTGYNKPIYCASEHVIWTEGTENYIEYRDHEFPIVFVPSKFRRDKIKNMTDKIIIPIGTRFIPYAEPVIDKFILEAMKKNLGKTIVVYPQHNNIFSRFEDSNENFDKLMKLTLKIKEEYDYDTVLICMFFADIENGTFLRAKDYPFQIVTCGRNTSYDFAMISTALFELGDLVISQSFQTIVMSSYFDKPAMFMRGPNVLHLKDGSVIENQSGSVKMDETFHMLQEMFGEYHENLTKEQKEWCAIYGGYDCVKTKDEMIAFFELAEEMKKKGISKKNSEALKQILRKTKYRNIRKYVLEG